MSTLQNRLSQQKIFVYNLKVDFVQAVALQRDPETEVDAVTWELVWFACGSKGRLARAIPQNLEVLTGAFIRDFRRANPKDNETSAPDSNNPSSGTEMSGKPGSGSKTTTHGFIASKGSDVFHKPDCRWAGNISKENIVSYKTREEAIKAHKRPCKWCNP